MGGASEELGLEQRKKQGAEKVLRGKRLDCDENVGWGGCGVVWRRRKKTITFFCFIRRVELGSLYSLYSQRISTHSQAKKKESVRHIRQSVSSAHPSSLPVNNIKTKTRGLTKQKKVSQSGTTARPTQLNWPLSFVFCPLSFVVLLQRKGHEHNIVPKSAVGDVDDVDDGEVLKWY